jgi:hypothetical protein
MLPQLGTLDDGRPLVEQASEGTQQPGLALSALAEEHDVVSGDQRPFELRQHGVLEAQDSGPNVAPLRERSQQVLPNLRLDASLAVPGGPQLADGTGELVR